MYWAYLLYSPSFDKFYCGSTGHLPLRFWQHNFLSEDSYTSKYRPWKLLLWIRCSSRSEAMKLEKLLKRQKNKHFYKQWVEERKKDIRLVDFQRAFSKETPS